MHRWEYFVAYVEWDKDEKNYYLRQLGNKKGHILPNALDALGSEGWELATSHNQFEWHGGQHVHIRDQAFVYVFKRSIGKDV